MPSTFTGNTGIEKIADGEQTGLWGQTTNLNFDIVDRALNGSVDVALSGTTHTLTTSEGLLSDGQFAVLTFTGSPSGTNTVTIEPATAQKLYFVRNATSEDVVLTQGSGGNVTVPPGLSKVVFSNGAGAGAAVFDITNTLSGNLTGDLTGNVTGNVTGNAGTATALQTARTIGGVSFDGTANIDLPGVNVGGNQNTTGNAATATTLATPRDFTIGATTRSFDGSTNVTWSLGDIGIVLTDKPTAEAGTNNTEFMTPLRTAQQTTARIATEAEAEAGTDNTKLMTPLRTAQAIEELAGAGLEPGDSLVSARPLGLPEFISQPGLYLKADFPLIGNLSAFFAQAINWSTVTSGFGTTIEDVATDGSGTWVAVGASGTMTRSTNNGVSWSAVTSGFGTTVIEGVATDGSGTWVAVGRSGIMTRSTNNGASWSAVTSGFGSTNILDVATDGSGVWVAVGASGTMTRSTNNGASWSAVTSGFGTRTIQGVATDGSGTWVAVGFSGTMTRSTDNGANWSSVTSGFGFIGITSVATDGSGTWVAVGASGVMTRSTDNGANWSSVTSNFGSTTIQDVATDGSGVWVAVGVSGIMTRSASNGVSWSAVTSGFGTTVIEGVATDGSGTWVAVGRSGIMTRSEPPAAEFFVSNDYADKPRYLFTGETA